MQLLAYIFFYGATWLLAVLPRWLFYFFSDCSAVVLYYLIRYRRKVAEDNLRYSFPELSPKARRKIARRFYRHLTDLIFESAFLMHASARRIARRCDFTNLDLLEAQYDKGKSVVIAAAHYNNWEFLTAVAPRIRHHMLSIYKPINNKRIERLINRSREKLGSETVTMKNTLRTVIKYEREGIPTLIGLITDQTPTGENHYMGEFLNQPTRVFRGIEHIAQRFDLPVFFCNMQRGKKRGYYVVTLEPITDAPNTHKPDWITAQHVQALERCIRANPPFWLWSHRRWKYTRNQI